jgi:hypothetical protein
MQPCVGKKIREPEALRAEVANTKTARQAGGMEKNSTRSRKLHGVMLSDGWLNVAVLF